MPAKVFMSSQDISGKEIIQAKINADLFCLVGFFFLFLGWFVGLFFFLFSEDLTQICSPIRFGMQQNKMLRERVQNRA